MSIALPPGATPQNRALLDKTLKAPLPEWNKGIFDCEIRKLLLSVDASKGNGSGSRRAAPGAGAPPAGLPKHFQKGTLEGTKAALTQVYDAYTQRLASFYDVMNFESSLSLPTTIEKKREDFQWSNRADSYPPHLETIPPDQQTPTSDIFDAMRLQDVQKILANLIPPELADTAPSTGASIAEVWSKSKDIFDQETIAEREDWYTDAIFAQLFFTGPDPTVIKLATHPSPGSGSWLDEFKAAAAQQESPVLEILSKPGETFFVADYSAIRTAMGIPEAPLTSTPAGATPAPNVRYATAPVALLHLTAQGLLHPLAIVIDYKSNSILESVTVFNKRLAPTYPNIDPSEEKDWGWRYAKTCVSVANWFNQEVGSHLCHTHLMEESVIVATHRAFPDTSPIFQLLSPHWLKTLSLNAAARSLLMPGIIIPLSGFTPPQVMAYLNHSYNNFSWEGRYLPTDLANRGFTEEKLKESKYNNYAYARDMHAAWDILKSFVTEYLDAFPKYCSDANIKADREIANWVSEMQNGGGIKDFPNIQTRAELIDALTMCICLATSQHNSVNYTQQYYMSFVLNLPTSLCSPVPTTLEQVHGMSEAQFMEAFPINNPARLRDWLLAAHVPYLLSYKVAQDQTIMNYALSLYKTSTGQVKKAAENLVQNLNDLKQLVQAYSDLQTDGLIPYLVLDPDTTAVSILI